MNGTYITGSTRRWLWKQWFILILIWYDGDTQFVSRKSNLDILIDTLSKSVLYSNFLKHIIDGVW